MGAALHAHAMGGKPSCALTSAQTNHLVVLADVVQSAACSRVSATMACTPPSPPLLARCLTSWSSMPLWQHLSRQQPSTSSACRAPLASSTAPTTQHCVLASVSKLSWYQYQFCAELIVEHAHHACGACCWFAWRAALQAYHDFALLH